MSDEPEEQDQPDEYDPDDYPDYDDHDNVIFKADWIAAGILFFRVRPIDGEKEFEHCPEVSAAFVMKVTSPMITVPNPNCRTSPLQYQHGASVVTMINFR